MKKPLVIRGGFVFVSLFVLWSCTSPSTPSSTSSSSSSSPSSSTSSVSPSSSTTSIIVAPLCYVTGDWSGSCKVITDFSDSEESYHYTCDYSGGTGSITMKLHQLDWLIYGTANLTLSNGIGNILSGVVNTDCSGPNRWILNISGTISGSRITVTPTGWDGIWTLNCTSGTLDGYGTCVFNRGSFTETFNLNGISLVRVTSRK